MRKFLHKFVILFVLMPLHSIVQCSERGAVALTGSSTFPSPSVMLWQNFQRNFAELAPNIAERAFCHAPTVGLTYAGLRGLKSVLELEHGASRENIVAPLIAAGGLTAAPVWAALVERDQRRFNTTQVVYGTQFLLQVQLHCQRF